MRKFVLIFIMCALYTAKAEEEPDTTLNRWIPKGVASFNISQIAFKDWTQGGDNAITYTIGGDFSLLYKSRNFDFKNSLKIAYGQNKIGEEDFKTNNNEIYLESVLSRRIKWPVNPYISNLIRTTIAPGFKYDQKGDQKIAAFFDPGYLTQSLGFAYNPLEFLTTRMGVAFQETFTNNFRHYTDDPETTDKKEAFKFETGMETVTDVNVNFMENMNYKSKLRLFTRFEALDVWDVRWDNSISAKVNSVIVVNFNVLVIYEKSQSLRTQIKEALQLGITYSLFE